MSSVAVIAHSGKTFGGGIGELRDLLDAAGVTDPLWYEVAKSKQAPDCARDALEKGAGLVFVWGGDGTVQRCVDALAGSDVDLAILPAGTANLLATNLDIPKDLPAAVDIGLHGDRRRLDTGTLNGEHFAVMAGAGLDALMIRDADGGMKDRIGRAAYLWTGARNLSASPVKARIKVDGRKVYSGTVTCVLVGNVGSVFGGLELFEGSRPDDGLLEVGIVTAKSRTQWARTVGRVVLGRAEKSPFVTTSRGRKIRVRFDRRVACEVDGGDRPDTEKLRITVRPGSIRICVPSSGGAQTSGSAPTTDQPELTS